MRMIIPALATLALASPVMAQDEAAQDDAPDFAALVSVTYECERGVELPVVYINQQDGPGHVVALIEGRMMTLPQVISASGRAIAPMAIRPMSSGARATWPSSITVTRTNPGSCWANAWPVRPSPRADGYSDAA